MSSKVTIAYSYRTRWGAHDEFVALFERNHWPILREQLAAGRFVAVEAHSDAEIAARLFPDRDRFAADERRRFELLEAHWDVVLEPHPLP